MRNRIRVVLDTNILLVSISSKSKYHWIFSNLLNNQYELYVTNEVLLEYEEIISSKYSEDNKFVDCYLISNSDMLVTNDKHFDILKEIDFPKVNIVKIDVFEEWLSR